MHVEPCKCCKESKVIFYSLKLYAYQFRARYLLGRMKTSHKKGRQ